MFSSDGGVDWVNAAAADRQVNGINSQRTEIVSDIVTVTEAARRLGVDKALVSRQVRRFGLMGEDKRFSMSAYEQARARGLNPLMRRDRPIDAGLLAHVQPASTDATPPAPSSAPTPASSVVSAVTEHKQLQAEMLRLQIARERGELVDRSEVDAAYMTAGRALRDAMMALPARAAQEVVGLTDVADVRRVLEARVREALDALAGALEAGDGADDEDRAAA